MNCFLLHESEIGEKKSLCSLVDFACNKRPSDNCNEDVFSSIVSVGRVDILEF